MNLKTTNDFKSIVLNETPLIDVRAPIEFEKGAFRNAVNLPIMNNEERHQIGIKYKQSGNEEATKLGHQLVSGENKEAKVNAWKEFIKANPDAIIYCFRGGQRSRIAQEWIQEAIGREILRLEGGYKAFRHYLLDFIEQENYPFKALRLGGYTGSGKTILLKEIENSIDLEGLAKHRGSSFGRLIEPQPSQINFDNNMVFDIIQTLDKGFKHLIFEDEGKNVGRCRIPVKFFEYMHSSNLLVLDVPFERRVEITMEEYVVNAQKEHIEHYGEKNGLYLWHEYVTGSINRIRKRLGGALCQELLDIVDEAFDEQKKTGSFDKHRIWVGRLLKEYYDPMYTYQMSNNAKKIIFKGDEKAILQYIKDLENK